MRAGAGGRDSIRLLFWPIDRWRVYVVAKVSSGTDGWLWYVRDGGTKTSMICALVAVERGTLRGLQLALGPLTVFVLWASREAREADAAARAGAEGGSE